LHDVPENLRGEDFKVSDGVACETCHGAAENWLRAHTRKDYSRADRTAAGMRDLQNLYVRANTCVACHQNLDADILKAGHPELIFELDGQSVAEPKHWRAEKNGNGAQAWLIGQAVALREMSWQLVQEKSPTENQLNRWAALAWLLPAAVTNIDEKVSLPASSTEAISLATRIQAESEKLARNADMINWTDELTRRLLSATVNSRKDFRNNSISQNLQARRAERLLLALDRLVAALPELKNNAPVQSSLNQLFQLAQSIPDFDPKAFADALDKFSTSIAGH
jgi:hypothetical protein